MIDYSTFFFKAVERGDTTAVATMLASGVSPDISTTKYGVPRTAFWVAALREKKDICWLLLEHGADIRLHINDDGSEFPNMLYMVVWDTGLSVELINRGLNPHAKSPSGINLMWWAHCAKNKELMRTLAGLGVYTGVGQSDEGDDASLTSSLHWSAAHFDVDMLAFQLDLGASIHVRLALGQSLLHSACAQSDSFLPAMNSFNAVLSFLLSKGLDINVQDGFGNTPLHYAVGATPYGGTYPVHRDVLFALIDNGADLNAKNDRGLTPFDLADGLTQQLIDDHREKSGLPETDVSRSS